MIAEDLTERATDALLQWRSREVFATDLSSEDIRGFSRELRMRSIFSARTTNAEYLGEIGDVVDDILAGKINMADGRLRLFRKLRELGYDPEVGFPQDMAQIPPAERGSLQDLSSESRLNLVLETSTRIAANYGLMVEGNRDYARFAYPAWELVRLYARIVPRGTPESHSAGWEARWHDAGEAVNWEGVATLERVRGEATGMIARKDSPIWQALGDGAGDYQDTLSNPFPPFAFRSGMAWRAVDRARCIELGLVTADEVPEPMNGRLTPSQETVNEIFDRMPADLQEELRRELEDDSEAERLRAAQEDFSRREEATAAPRRSRAAERQAAHRNFVEGLLA